jgi:23S rRNA (adenine2503-C2)-methyltransferase
MRALQGLTLHELTDGLKSRTRAIEVLKWLYAQPSVPSELPASIAGVSHKVWAAFIAKTPIACPRIAERQEAEDGTTKYALEFDGTSVETVRIPGPHRSTICISSQAGCTRKCVFCATKELGFIRQLKAEEMVAQFMVARAEAKALQPAKNVVFMGMGEPMDNLDEVLRAVEILTQSPTPQLRAEAVTVSTSGVVPGMQRFLKESKGSLALSLNATTDETRTQLMPQNKIWPIESMMQVLRDAAVVNPKRHTFVEYVLFDGVNDSDADADRLVAWLRGIPSRVNVIPYNPYPGTGLTTPSRERMMAFHARVAAQGQLCLIRWPRGRDIAAACGQLVLAKDGQGFQGNAG